MPSALVLGAFWLLGWLTLNTEGRDWWPWVWYPSAILIGWNLDNIIEWITRRESRKPRCGDNCYTTTEVEMPLECTRPKGHLGWHIHWPASGGRISWKRY